MGWRQLGPVGGCVSGYRSWDWAVRSEETELSLSHSGALPSFDRERAGPWGAVCVVSGVGGEKGRLAPRGWIFKDLLEEMTGPGGRKV